MIKKKKKVCKTCGEECYIWSKGNCRSCDASSKTTSTLQSKNKLKSSNKRIRKFNPKSREKRSKERSCLEVYFEYHIERCNSSDETGKAIYNANRSSICHLLPKRTYKSVMCNIDNCVYLTLEEHTRFDYLLDTFKFDVLEKEFKNSWKIACERYKKLIPLTEESGKLIYKLKEYLKLWDKD